MKNYGTFVSWRVGWIIFSVFDICKPFLISTLYSFFSFKFLFLSLIYITWSGEKWRTWIFWFITSISKTWPKTQSCQWNIVLPASNYRRESWARRDIALEAPWNPKCSSSAEDRSRYKFSALINQSEAKCSYVNVTVCHDGMGLGILLKWPRWDGQCTYLSKCF